MVVGALVCAAAALGQNGPVFRVDTKLVEVHATVRIQNGRHLADLSKEQFEIRENGERQPIVSFESKAGSLSCAVLIDATGSMRTSLPHVKRAVADMLRALRPDDAAAVYSFNDGIQLIQDFTADKAAAVRALAAIRAAGPSAIYDGLVGLVRELEHRPGKKAILVFTDGDDNASLLTAAAAIRRANAAGIPIYGIAEGSARVGSGIFESLKQISAQTGARSFQARSKEEVAAVLRQVSEDLRHTYLLAYKPPSTGDSRWRTIEVSVPGLKGSRIVARNGYFPR